MKVSKSIDDALEKFQKAEDISPAWERVTIFAWNDLCFMRDEITRLQRGVEALRLERDVAIKDKNLFAESVQDYKQIEKQLRLENEEQQGYLDGAAEYIDKLLSGALDRDKVRLVCAALTGGGAFPQKDYERAVKAATELLEQMPREVCPDHICALCYHDKSESGTCNRPDCEQMEGE